MKRLYPCPWCSRILTSSQQLVHHMLKHRPKTGVTTGEFLAAGAGSRFGARIHELRHDHDLRIAETRERDGSSRYVLLAAGRPAPPASPSAGAESGGPAASSLFDAEPVRPRNALYGDEAA